MKIENEQMEQVETLISMSKMYLEKSQYYLKKKDVESAFGYATMALNITMAADMQLDKKSILGFMTATQKKIAYLEEVASQINTSAIKTRK